MWGAAIFNAIGGIPSEPVALDASIVSSYERPGGVSCSTLSMTGFLRLIVTVYRTPVKIPFHTTA